jgi:hypothetical protein
VIVGNGSALLFELIAVAGPSDELVLWLGLAMLLKRRKTEGGGN